MKTLHEAFYPPTKPRRCTCHEDHARLSACFASMPEPMDPTPEAGPKAIEDVLAGEASKFFDGQSLGLKVEYNDLVDEGQKLQVEREGFEARYPSFKPVGRMLNKQWFLKEGEENDKKLAKMMEGFEKAGGEKEHVEQVKRAFEEMLEKVKGNKMQVVILREFVGQYRQLS